MNPSLATMKALCTGGWCALAMSMLLAGCYRGEALWRNGHDVPGTTAAARALAQARAFDPCHGFIDQRRSECRQRQSACDGLTGPPRLECQRTQATVISPSDSGPADASGTSGTAASSSRR